VELYWWLKPGVYFTYLYELPQPYIYVSSGYEYETSILLINYTILNVINSRALINLSLTFVNAIVYERCNSVFCPIVEEGVNETLHALLELDLKTLGVYINNTWIDEWLYLATTKQLKGEAPKLIRVHGVIYGFSFWENTDEEKITETFLDMLREELGEDLVECITVERLECEGFPPVYGHHRPMPGVKDVTIRTQGGYIIKIIKPPPSDLTFTIKNYTISGDRVAMIGASGDSTRSIIDAVRLGLLEVKRNVSLGYKRAYAFEVKFTPTPLKLYAVRVFDIPERTDIPEDVLNLLEEQLEKDAFFDGCVLYNPSRREVFLVDGLGCSSPLTRIVGYYDYYTGVLLYLNVSWGELGLMPIQAYTRLLGLEEVVKFPIHFKPKPPHETSAELVLVDTNISFERPVIGGAEDGFNLVHVAIVGVVISIGIIGVKVALSRRKRSLTM
jgi:hypothetical protein